jgi:hypothetical protein
MTQKESLPLLAAEPVIRKHTEPNPNGLKKWTRLLLNNGIKKGKRNQSVYEIAVDLWRNGFSREQALAFLGEKRHNIEADDFTWKEIHTTVWSAYRKLEDNNA